MPKEPFNKGDAVLRTEVLHAKRIIAEELMFQGPKSGKILTSGGANLQLQPEGDGEVFIRDQQIGGGAPATIQIRKDGILEGFADVLDYKESGVDINIVSEVASLLFAQKTDTTIEVSAEYTASDAFQQYSTIAAALVRSAYLKGIGKSATIVVKPGYYAEDLHNLNSETIFFEAGAFLVGSATPNVPLISIAGGVVFLTDVWSYTALGVHKTDLLRVNGGNCFSNRCVLGFPQLDDADHALYATHGGGFFGVSGFLGWADQESVVIEGSAPPYRHMLNTTLDSFNKTPLKLVNGGLGSLTTTIQLMNCSLSSIENILLSAESYNVFFLYSTLVEINRMSLATGFAQIGYWHSAKAINQTVFPEPGEGKGTIQYALEQLDAWQQLNEPAIKNNSMNIATILAESEFQGPFDGVIVEAYPDAGNIDAGNSYNYRVRPNSVLELGDFHDTDDFESYADTAALQIAWPTNSAFWDCSLNTIDAIEGAQCMEILIGASPTTSHRLRYTYGAPQDQHGVCCCRGFMRGIVGTGFRIRAVDSGGNFNTSPILYPGPEWVYFSVDLTADPSFDPTDVTNVDIVYAAGSSGQTLLLDELYFVGTDVFTNDALIDEMDAVVADWTAIGGGFVISQNTTDKYSGTGSMQVVAGAAVETDRIVRDDFVSGQDWGEDTALNIWVKVTAVTVAGTLKLQPRIYDDAARRIDLPSIIIDSSRLGDGWYPIPIPFTRFGLGVGIIFTQSNVKKVEFYAPESSVFRGTFLLDLFQRGYAAQAQSVDADETFWPPVPHQGQGGLAMVEQHGGFEDIDLDDPALADISMVSINPWKFDLIDEDPPFQIFGRNAAELKTWFDLEQFGSFFKVRVLAFGLVNVSGWTFTWR